jgi:hypothetical protein
MRELAPALLGSRLLVWASGMVAFVSFGRTAHLRTFDPWGLTGGLGRLGDVLASPAARWDSAWYLSIADGGYGAHALAGADGRIAFFPLYPLLVRGVGSLGVGLVAAGVLVSLVAFAVALGLIYRLAELELPGMATRAGRGGLRGVGADVPRLAVLATALYPMAFFFSAIYSEALYLALSVGAFWMARRGRWAWAGALAALAAATRSIGVLLVLPLAILYLYGPREDRAPDLVETDGAGGASQRARGSALTLAARLRPRYRIRLDALWIALVPAGLAAFLGYLAAQGADPLSPFHVQEVWYRHFAGPFGGIVEGAEAAFEGARQLLSGSRRPVYFTPAGGDPFIVAGHNLLLFAFLVAAVPVLVGVIRRLPAAYGAYLVAALALPLSYPVSPQPLMSLPRFLAVLFPLHLCVGYWLATHPRARLPVLGFYGVALAFFTAEFATWHWVA